MSYIKPQGNDYLPSFLSTDPIFFKIETYHLKYPSEHFSNSFFLGEKLTFYSQKFMCL